MKPLKFNRIFIICLNCHKYKGVRPTGKVKHKKKNVTDFKRNLNCLNDKILFIQVECLNCHHIWYSQSSEAVLAYKMKK